jgi:hypothetical protein
MKPGIYTTEFWISLVSAGVAVFGIMLGMSASDQLELVGQLKGIIIAGGSILANVVLVWNYVASRTNLKRLDMMIQANTTEADEEHPSNEVSLP